MMVLVASSALYLFFPSLRSSGAGHGALPHLDMLTAHPGLPFAVVPAPVRIGAVATKSNVGLVGCAMLISTNRVNVDGGVQTITGISNLNFERLARVNIYRNFPSVLSP